MAKKKTNKRRAIATKRRSMSRSNLKKEQGALDDVIENWVSAVNRRKVKPGYGQTMLNLARSNYLKRTGDRDYAKSIKLRQQYVAVRK